MTFSFVVLKSVGAKKSFTNTSLTPVLKTFKIIINFNTFNLEYTEKFCSYDIKTYASLQAGWYCSSFWLVS